MIKHKIPQHSKKQRARRQREKRSAAAVAEYNAHERQKPRERRQANIAKAARRDGKILEKRDPVAFKERQARRVAAAGVIKPTFE